MRTINRKQRRLIAAAVRQNAIQPTKYGKNLVAAMQSGDWAYVQTIAEQINGNPATAHLTVVKHLIQEPENPQEDM